LRQQISLDGPWEFQIDPAGTLAINDIDTWRTIDVPGPWQAQLDDLHMVAGVGWYRRPVSVPESWAGRSVFLTVGAADYFAEVWVNGQSAGQHEGGYLPFELDITPYLSFGAQNDLVIRVTDPGPRDQDIFPQFPFGEIPHGKQSWYGPIGGLWQSVALEARPKSHIAQVHITPQGLSGTVSAAVRLVHPPHDGAIRLNCLAPDGKPAAQASAAIAPGQAEVVLSFTVASPLIWDLDSPHLYTLEVVLEASGQPVDQQMAQFGIRTIEARDGKLWLNGRLLYLRGALDQDYYPQGIYTPPSMEFLRSQVRQAKAMGLNCLRCHIKIADPRYLQAADEEGILVWAEVPSWRTRTQRAGDRVRETFAAMVARDWNHPSIVIWTIVNENWGTDLVNSADDRQWLRETADWARTVDPHRLIVDNSACFVNFHMNTDIEDYHFYAAMPENMDRWQEYVTNFASRAPFTFSPNDDAIRRGDEPLVISEFGNWGLPDINKLREAYGGRDPWWFDTGKEWEPSVVWPLGAEDRFKAAGLDRVFGDWSGLAEKAQWAQYRALKHEIEVMRAEASICGYVITEWTDLHWECNGLVDMARNARVFADLMPAFNADTVIVPRWERTAYWSGETVQIDLLVAHYGPEPLNSAAVHWSVEGTELRGSLPLPQVASGGVVKAGTITFSAPEVSGATLRDVVFWLGLSSGPTMARNHQTLALLPRALARVSGAASVWSEDAALRDWLSAHGYTLDQAKGIRLVTSLDQATLAHVRDGGRALVCATSPKALEGLPGGVRVEAREHTPWSGDWASSFAWVRPGVTQVPGGPMIDFNWRGVFPKHVITGVAADHTLAGLFVGWVHQAVALIGRVPVDAGMLLVSTFPVLPPEDHPVRTVLLHDLIRAASEG